jgi:hypothetical protein
MERESATVVKPERKKAEPGRLGASVGRVIQPASILERGASTGAISPARTESSQLTPESIDHVLGRPGSPLAPATRAYFEQRLNSDFSSVPVHTDNAASEVAQETQVRAYTTGALIHRKSPMEESGRSPKPKLQANQREQEADQVSEQVMNMPPSTPATALTKTDSSPIASAPALPIVSDAIQSPGQPLDSATRAFMEASFGHDLSDVRVHTGEPAARSAAALDANAFTFGRDIVFAANRFAPGSPAGKRLLAHELTHVIQQRHSGKAELALQSSGTVLDQALDLTTAVDNSKTAQERKPLLKTAFGLGDTMVDALLIAKGPQAPPGSASEDDARQGLKRIIKILFHSNLSEGEQNITVPKALDLSIKSNDAEIQQTLASELIPLSEGVSGQKRLLTILAPWAGQKVAPGGAKATQWLESNTDAIGKTFKKLDDVGLQGLQGDPLGLDLSRRLLDQYFTHVEEDIKPDPMGKISGQKVGSSGTIEADCDVYATYAARLLRQEGWETAGYLSIKPKDKKPTNPSEDRDMHAVALVRKPNAKGGWWYLGVSNHQIRDLGPWSYDQNALLVLTWLALEAYSPSLGNFDAYYLPAGPGGKYDERLLDPEANSLQAYESVRNNKTRAIP